MDENKNQEQAFDLDDILKEFGSESEQLEPEEIIAEEPDPIRDTVQLDTVPQDTLRFDAVSQDTVRFDTVSQDTVRLDAPVQSPPKQDLGDTVRFSLPEDAYDQPVAEEEPVEPFSEEWEPEYEQPIGEYVPPQPIVFRPKSRLQELKRKLIAGPEKRYYELAEQGLGKLQAAIFLNLLIAVAAIGATFLYSMNYIPAQRLRLMIFWQFLALLLSA